MDMIVLYMFGVGPHNLARMISCACYSAGRSFGTFHGLIWILDDFEWCSDNVSNTMSLQDVGKELRMYAAGSSTKLIVEIDAMWMKLHDEVLVEEEPVLPDYRRRIREKMEVSGVSYSTMTYLREERSRRDNGKTRYKVQKMWGKRL
jgi:hypothetical protein